MARLRKGKEATIETLFKAPWWTSVAIGVAALVVLKWILPSAWASNVFLEPLATTLSGMAWLFSALFFVVGLLSFIREKFSASRSANLSTTWKAPPPPSYQATESSWQERVERYSKQEGSADAPDRVHENWEALMVGSPPVKTKPTEWNLDLLRELEWKRFEDVCQQFYALKGIKSETTPLGPDGGIDIRLFQDDAGKPTSIVQCKAWGERNIGIKPVRELLGVMAHEKVEKAFFMASGNFTDEAKTFAQSNRITLINGEMLLTMIQRLSELDRQALLAFATEGDYRTPTCPSCGIKMRRVPGTNGRPDFWGCQHYPRCRQKLGIRASTA